MTKDPTPLVLDLSEVGAGDVNLLGESVPAWANSFAPWCRAACGLSMGLPPPAKAYRLLLETNGLGERLRELMSGLDHRRSAR